MPQPHPVKSPPPWYARLAPRALLRVSIAVALLTIALKMGAWWLTDSVGLLSDAMESFVNLAGAMFALLMVTIARRPPDEDHPYGHSKAEYFSSGFEGILIIGAALAIFWAAAARLIVPQPLQELGWGTVLSVISSVCNGALAAVMLQSSRTHRSKALEADARHLITDVWTSAGVVAALAGVALTGWLWLDGLIAMIVALNILREGIRLLWEGSRGLMDEALDAGQRTRIQEVLAEYEADLEGTVYFDNLVSRKAGEVSFVQMHMHVPEEWTLARAAALRLTVEARLMAAVPGLQATLEILPIGMETAFEEQQLFKDTHTGALKR